MSNIYTVFFPHMSYVLIVLDVSGSVRFAEFAVALVTCGKPRPGRMSEAMICPWSLMISMWGLRPTCRRHVLDSSDLRSDQIGSDRQQDPFAPLEKLYRMEKVKPLAQLARNLRVCVALSQAVWHNPEVKTPTNEQCLHRGPAGNCKSTICFSEVKSP